MNTASKEELIGLPVVGEVSLGELSNCAHARRWMIWQKSRDWDQKKSHASLRLSPFEMQKVLHAASGYLELGMIAEAEGEIESLAPEDKNQREVLGVRLEIFRTAGSYSLMEVARPRIVETPSRRD